MASTDSRIITELTEEDPLNSELTLPEEVTEKPELTLEVPEKPEFTVEVTKETIEETKTNNETFSLNEEARQRAANAERLEAGKKKKDLGNEFFKNGNIQEALRNYHKALLDLNGLQNNKSFAIFRKDQNKQPDKDPLQEDIIKTVALVYSNMAACQIKLNKSTRAIECANQALKNDPTNEKALFRRAQAYINEGNVDGAEADLKKLSEKNPDDPGIKREWQRLKLKDKQQEKKQRQDLKGIFERLRKQEEKEEAEKTKLSSSNSNNANEPKIQELDPDEE
ncbi:hypothetical protein G9A89_012910 [Geosiphon pyriformis]|nr:hypothetical protein G9A89_012910 [Geosiphon pyriformis]